MVQILLDSNADPDVENSQGKQPYDCTSEENIRHALRLREIYIDEEEFCLVERDRRPHAKRGKKVQVLEARDDSDKSSIVEQFGHSVKGQYILVLDAGEGGGGAGLSQCPSVNREFDMVDNDIVCPVIVSRLSRARPRLRKFARMLASKIPAVDVTTELPFFRQSNPDITAYRGNESNSLRSSDPLNEMRYLRTRDVHSSMDGASRELSASVELERKAPPPFEMSPAFRPYCNLDHPLPGWSLPPSDAYEEEEEEEEEELELEEDDQGVPPPSPYSTLYPVASAPPPLEYTTLDNQIQAPLPFPTPSVGMGYQNLTMSDHSHSSSSYQTQDPPLNLASSCPPSDLRGSDMRLVKLLQDLELSKYIDVFLAEEWDWDSLLEITNSDLIDMGIKAGSRRKLISAISRVRSGLSDPILRPRSAVHSSLLSLASQESSHSQRTRTEELIDQCSYIVDYSEITVRSHLGKGFYGSVYLGTWNGVDVAIKEVSQPLESIEKWVMEVELLQYVPTLLSLSLTLPHSLLSLSLSLPPSLLSLSLSSKLRHPNIVMFYCACVKAPNYCIVLEYAAQGSLEKVLQSLVVDLSHARRLSILCDIARGMKYLHAQQPPIIHRDLKSDNVLIDANWVAKVSDLGLSRYKDSTYSYGKANSPFDVTIAAAEVLQDNHISEKADVYSFSLIMWELYTRHRPYKNMNPRWVAEKVIHDHMRPSMKDTAHWDPNYVGLMKSCWSENYKDRPSFPDILSALETMIEGEYHSPPSLPHSSIRIVSNMSALPLSP